MHVNESSHSCPVKMLKLFFQKTDATYLFNQYNKNTPISFTSKRFAISDLGYEARWIMYMINHINELSIRSYTRNISTRQKASLSTPSLPEHDVQAYPKWILWSCVPLAPAQNISYTPTTGSKNTFTWQNKPDLFISFTFDQCALELHLRTTTTRINAHKCFILGYFLNIKNPVCYVWSRKNINVLRRDNTHYTVHKAQLFSIRSSLLHSFLMYGHIA